MIVQFVTKLSDEGVIWNITSTQFMRKRNLIDINAQFVIFKHPQIKSCKSIFIKFIRQIFTVEIDTLENCILGSICLVNYCYMSRFLAVCILLSNSQFHSFMLRTYFVSIFSKFIEFFVHGYWLRSLKRLLGKI